MEYTKDQIKEKLLTDNKWLARGIIAIYNKQTSDEQQSEDTRHHNGIGFNGADGRWGASFAKFAIRAGFLTPKQIKYVRPKMVKYAGQLTKIANGEI